VHRGSIEQAFIEAMRAAFAGKLAFAEHLESQND
jgi:hypothetical protein